LAVKTSWKEQPGKACQIGGGSGAIAPTPLIHLRRRKGFGGSPENAEFLEQLVEPRIFANGRRPAESGEAAASDRAARSEFYGPDIGFVLELKYLPKR
jgi:hypothetical protein